MSLKKGWDVMSVTVIYFDLVNTLVFGTPGNMQPFDDAVATIHELWWRGYKIGLLSDQQPGTTEWQARQLLDDYRLEKYCFDVITISSEFDPPVYMPDPLIFDTAVTKAGHTAASNQTVFVTEDLIHIEAARNLGWRAIHKPYEDSCTPQSGECVEDLDDLLALFPPLPVDLFIRDAPDDPGDDLYTGSEFWDSPDLWIRHKEDGGLTHQPPKEKQDNWFYTRVHNRGEGIVRAFTVVYTVQEWAGTEFVYPADYDPLPSLAYAVGTVKTEPGDSQVVFAKWEAADVPPAGTHACWLALALPPAWSTEVPATGAHVWEHNNLAQKNLTIIDLEPGQSGEIPVVLGSRHIPEARFCRFEIIRSIQFEKMPVSLIGASRKSLGNIVRAGQAFVHQPKAVAGPARGAGIRFLEPTVVELTGLRGEKGGPVTLELESGSTLTFSEAAKHTPARRIIPAPDVVPASLVDDAKHGATVDFAPGRVSGIAAALRPWQIVRARLLFTVPKTAKPGDKIDLELVQRGEDGRIVGGIAVQVNVQKPKGRRKPRGNA
jgi:hypothetical protein